MGGKVEMSNGECNSAKALNKNIFHRFESSLLFPPLDGLIWLDCGQLD